jgi:hypothetical protein
VETARQLEANHETLSFLTIKCGRAKYLDTQAYRRHGVKSHANSDLGRTLSRQRDGLARPEFDSQQNQEIFLFSVASRPALGSTQLLIQRVRGEISQQAKWLGHEADLLLPFSAEVKNGEDIPPLPFISSWGSA